MDKLRFDFEKPIREREKKLVELEKKGAAASEINALKKEIEQEKEQVYKNLHPWQRVQIARHPHRPRTLDYIHHIFDIFIELQGDRAFRDDPAIVGGLAKIEEFRVVVLGHQKGKGAKDSAYRNFGMPHPEGYRKAQRLMKLGEKFSLPVITFIDTPGAYPDVEAEERGQAWAIAESIRLMSTLKVPIITFNVGEGGSGGALAIGVANRIYLLENAYYSVITPEGCASILWQDASKAPQAAEALKLTAEDLLSRGLIDEVIPEPLGGAHCEPEQVFQAVRKVILRDLGAFLKLSADKIVGERKKKLRQCGLFEET